jgi:hypothetical protein
MTQTILPNPGEALYGPVDSLEASAFGQCLNGAATLITNEQIPGFAPDRISIRHNTFIQDGEPTPRCIIAPFGYRISASEGTNRETVMHGLALVTFHWAQGQDAISKMGQCLVALETAHRIFSKKPERASGMNVNANGSQLKQMTVDSADALNLEAWRRGLMVVHLIVDFNIRMGYAANA